VRFAICAAVLLLPSLALAQDDVVHPAPPMAPFKRGPLVEGSVGIYAPTGRLKNYSSPGPWMRLSVGWDFSRWLAVFATGDAAFLSTNRAPPPPGERGYVVYGFGLGARFSIPATERIRFPLRVDLGAHRVEDSGVLSTYQFNSARDLDVSYGATAGVEWRAASRHLGIILEFGVRSDGALSQSGRSDSPLAIVSALSIHSTL
jgi:hypothetical protein